MKLKVQNLESTQTSNPVPNQFKITLGNKVYFQSYKSMICKIENNKVYLDKNYWDYSRTTSKYLYSFLYQNTFGIFSAINKKEILKMIDNKEIKLTNLN
jgi:hypothetical protein